MKPWREEFADEREFEAGELLARAAAVPEWSATGKREVWSRIDESARGPETAQGLPDRWLPLALAGSCALLVIAILHSQSVRRAGSTAAAPPAPIAAQTEVVESQDWTPVDLGAVGTLSIQKKAVYRLPAPAHARDYRISLDRGQICAAVAHRDPSAGPLVMQTPHLQVFVIGTRFCVDARQGESVVKVTEGRVRVQTAAGTAFVGAGETIGSTDPRLSAPPVPTEAPAAERPKPSATPPISAARALADSSNDTPPAPQGALPQSSLAEQNALYAQGAIARDQHDGTAALAAWRSYLVQFPHGVLAPEAAAGVLSVLVSEGRDREALFAADDYLSSYPADGRAAEVAFIRGNLLHEKFNRTADALEAYRRALALATRPGLRDDALFAVAACERMLGRTAEAQATFKEYQSEFPHGTHAAELSKWMGK